MAVGLAALDATVSIAGVSRSRTIPVEELHRLPGTEPDRDTVVERGELITAVELPTPIGRSGYLKVRDRASFAFAIVSVAAQLDVAAGEVRDVRLALGGVAHKPWRAHLAEDALRGGPPTEERFRRAAEAELAEARPLRDNGYKLPLTSNLVVRLLLELAGQGVGHERGRDRCDAGRGPGQGHRSCPLRRRARGAEPGVRGDRPVDRRQRGDPHRRSHGGARGPRRPRRPLLPERAATRRRDRRGARGAAVGYRTPTIQRVRLGADRDGRLAAIVHDVVEQTSTVEEFAEQTAVVTRMLYAAPNRRTTHRIAARAHS
jgi:hypothetical protein